MLSSAALIAALAALFASLRASLGGPTADASWVRASPDRGALEDEKNALLRALKDLEYEHEVGKIDDEDYARLERAYRARAKEVLTELDRDLRPYLSRAEELAGGVEPRGDKKAKKKKKGEARRPSEGMVETKVESESATKVESESESKVDSESATKVDSESESKLEAEAEAESEREGERESAPPTCPKCSTVNDADARFCKKCATPLAPAEATP